MSSDRLKGKVALITGAAKGIGKEIALLFAKQGATVILSDIDSEEGALAATEIGKEASYMDLDVTKEDHWQKACATILQDYQKLDILVNNAGITGFLEGFGPQDPENCSLKDWRAVNAVNSEGVFLGCKYAIKTMQKNNGVIINISSRSGIVGIPGAAAYASSKAAVRNHTKTVALYCCDKGYNIRCNSIHPAAILTPMWEPTLGTGEQRAKNLQMIEDGIPMKKMGTSEDVAYGALYLASDESKYVTGIELTIDGGILAGASATPSKNN